MATRLLCPNCSAPIDYARRLAVQRRGDGRPPRWSPALYCPRCGYCDEVPGYDLLAATSDALQLVAMLRLLIVKEKGPIEAVEILSHVINRYTSFINAEVGRYMRTILGTK